MGLQVGSKVVFDTRDKKLAQLRYSNTYCILKELLSAFPSKATNFLLLKSVTSLCGALDIETLEESKETE